MQIARIVAERREGESPPFYFARIAIPLALARHPAYFRMSPLESPVTQPSEPMFNVPPVVVATLAVLALVHALRMFVLSDDADLEFLLTFAFIPARYEPTLLGGNSFPGGHAAEIWTFATYSLIHADLMHLGFNVAWFLPFGSALARRFGSVRFLAFLAVASAAGAAAHLVSHSGQMVPMVGASAAISGCMAAAMRFALQQGGPLTLWRPSDRDAYRVPAASLGATLRNPRYLAFLAVWFGLNALLGLGTLPLAGSGQEVAWQAHMGGFLAGLLLFAPFDPVTPQAASGGNDPTDRATTSH
jgi:membrane associated rhomboid family serine protease